MGEKGEFLVFHELKKKYAKREVLSGVNFSIQKGEIFGLIGKSGSGKSTLLKILLGMVTPDKGHIIFDNNDTTKDLNSIRKNTGFSSQDNLLFNELTIKENAFYFGNLYGLKREVIKSRFAELLPLLGLDGFETLKVSDLSGGMAKRANLLISLIHYPRLLILDEPTVGLDPIIRSALWNYIKRINKEGMTILVVSHLLEEIEENCDRIAVLNKGKICAIASPKEYKKEYGDKSFNDIFKLLVQL